MKSRTLMTALTVGHFANDWSVCALWLLAPAIGIAMGLSPAKVGLLLTVVQIGGAVAYFPAGMLTDHVSNRGRLLMATFWWVGIGYALAALAPNFWTLALILAIAGMGDAAWHPIATGILTREAPQRRAHVIGVHAIGGSMAEILSPLFAGFLLTVVDWRVALALAGVPALIMGLYFIGFSRRVPKAERKRFNRGDLFALIHQWRTPNAMRMVAMICLYNMALIALLSMAPLYLADRHGFSLRDAGIAFAVMVVVGALAQPWIGKLSDRIGRRPIVILGTLVAAAAAVGVVFVPDLTSSATISTGLTLALMILAAGALDSIRAAVLAGAIDHTGHSEATTLGLAFVFLDGVGALGAVFAGMAANISWPHMFALTAAFALGACGLALTVAFAKSDPASGIVKPAE